MANEETKAKVKELVMKLSNEETLLFQRVIRAEQEKLHMGRAHGIKDDLERIVREVIK